MKTRVNENNVAVSEGLVNEPLANELSLIEAAVSSGKDIDKAREAFQGLPGTDRRRILNSLINDDNSPETAARILEVQIEPPTIVNKASKDEKSSKKHHRTPLPVPIVYDDG